MGSMRDQILKAGLVDKKQARKARHEEQSRQKSLGEAAVEAEQQSRDEEHHLARERQRAEDKQREIERRQQHEGELQSERVPSLIRSGQLKGSTGGNRRFFFVTAEQTVSFIEVAPPVVRSLADGHHAIVDARGVLNDDFCVVTADTARSIATLAPDRVMVWVDSAAGR